jgi:hypothetical protein
MKPWNFGKLAIGVLLTTLPLTGRSLEPTPGPPAVAESAVQPGLEAADSLSGSDLVVTNGEADIADAPAKSIATEKPLPPHIRPDAPVAEVIKLANSGLDQSVMLAYVTNSTSTFNLGAEEIIYLNDIGVPSAVVTAMIQRDQELRNAGATGGPPGSTSVGTGAPPPPGTLPDQVAPQPVETAASVPQEPPPSPEVASDASFYDSLAPYGNWVDLSGYGWCWQPTVVVVNPYWQPYFDCGRWVYSNCGWYWNSNYSWGWAPFHYGRWFRHNHLGWCWMPDRVWGPSWVSWRYGDRYCGWAPLPPGSHFVAGVGLTFHGRPVRDYDHFGLHEGHYRFVTWDHFQDRQLSSHRLGPNQHAWAYKNSTGVTRISGDGHTIINNGLPPSRVAAATRAPVHTVSLREFSDSAPHSGRAEHYDASGRTLNVYRPHLSPAAPARNPGIRNRTQASPVNPAANRLSASEPAPWLNSEALATVMPNRPTRPGGTASDSRVQRSSPDRPLLLHGAQSATQSERSPRSSLIIIGRKDANGSTTTTMTVPETQSRPDAINQRSDVPKTSQRFAENLNRQPAENEALQRTSPWMLPRAEPARQLEAPGLPMARPEVPRYQAPTRRAPAEVPRYTPGPANLPQRSYSGSSMPSPAPARAPATEFRSAPSAPSAPPASRAQPSTQSRNSR